MSKDEALRLALEGFEKIKHHFDTDEYAYEIAVKSITAIKQALEQPEPPCKTGSQCTSKCDGCAEPEPVAWLYESVCGNDFATRCEPPSYARNIRPLYTSPPKREWQGLTDDEIRPLCDENHIIFGSYTVDFIQSIEAKLKAKNGFPQTESNT